MQLGSKLTSQLTRRGSSQEIIRYFIVGIMVHISFGLVFFMLQSSPVTSAIPSLTICYEGRVTANSVQLNINTSAIVGTNGSCQCRILFHMYSVFHMSSQHITSPNCGTDIILSDASFQYTCSDGSIPNISYAINVSSDVQLSLRANGKGDSDLPMSGTIQLNTDNNTNFTLECYETKVTRMTTTSTVTTSTIRSTSLTSSTLKTTLKTSTIKTTLKTSFYRRISSTTASSNVSRNSTTKESVQMISTSNGTSISVKKTAFPVALTAGCATGGVGFVGLVVVAVLICRRKKKRPKKTSVKKYETSSLQKRDTISIDDEHLSMENELYCSSGDLDIGSAVKANDNPNGIGEEGKKKHEMSPNGNIYTLVDKPRNQTSPPKPDTKHRAAPSGDVYTVVDKLK